MISVSLDGTKDYKSIQAAIDAIHFKQIVEDTIYVYAGEYNETIEVKTPKLKIIGEDPLKVMIKGHHFAMEYMADIGKRGTFRTYTMLIDAANVTLKNLSIINDSGYGEKIKQAIALYADGDGLRVENCRIISYQDTLFTGPLPPYEMEKNGFIGPKQKALRRITRQYYHNCFISGSIDFIFGSATCVFDTCELFSRNIHRSVNGYVTAPSTSIKQKYGYVFWNCRFTSDCPQQSVYLGRPWRNYAKVAIIHCEYGEHIIDEGWHDWDKPEALKTVEFLEYGLEHNIAKKRASFAKTINEENLNDYRIEKVLGGNWYK